MESTGNPPSPGDRREDDPALPSWYKPPEKPPSDPAASQPDETGPSRPVDPGWAPPPAPPGPGTPPPEAEDVPSTPVAEPPAGDMAPLAAEGAAAAAEEVAAADEDLPAWSRAREVPAAPEPPPAAAPAPAPAAVADAWTTRRDAALSPTWARLAPRRDHPHVFGDRMAAGVLLTLAAASMIGGGIDALVVAGSGIDSTIRAAICGAVALVLLGGAVALRLLRGSDDLRGALAVTGIAYAATCLAFAYNPQPLDDHDLLLKFTLAAGLVALLGWVAAVLVPSAVAGTIAVVALATAAGASVWLAQDQPTHSQVFVAAIGVGLAVALVLPAVGLLRPHPTGLGWALGGAALVITIPALVLMSRDDGFAIAAGATASAALLALAQEHRNLPAALGAFAGLGYLEVLLIGTRAVSDPNQQLVILVAVGVALLLVVSAVAVLAGRARPAALPRRRLPLGVTQLLLVAALVLSIVALFAGNTRDVRLTPNQLQPRPSQGSVALR